MFLISLSEESASLKSLYLLETFLTFLFDKDSQITGAQLSSIVITLFDVATFKGTISTF